MFTYPRGDLWCDSASQRIGGEVALPFDSVEDAADEDDTIVSPEWRRGELALQKGDVEAAIEADEDALRFFEQRIPAHTISFAVWLSWEIVVQIAHRLLRRWLVGSRDPNYARLELISARHYGRLAYSYSKTYAVTAALWAHLRELNLTEKYAPTLERAHAYGQHALLMSWLGQFERGYRYAVDSTKTFEMLGSPLGKAHAISIHAFVLHAAGHWPECIEFSQTAIAIYERIGNVRDFNFARCQRAASYLRLGRLLEAVEEANCIFQSTVQSGDRCSSAHALLIWAAASDGEIPDKAIRAELDRANDDAQVTSRLLQADGIRLLVFNQFEDAVEAFEKSYEIAKEAKLAKLYRASCQVWLTTALRELAEKHKDIEGDEGKSLLRRARTVARHGLRMARRFQSELPHALRECAAIAALQGKTNRALRLFEESLAVADQQHACHEYSKTLVIRGRLGKRYGWEQAGDDVADGQYMGNRLKNVRPTLQTPDDGTETTSPADSAAQ